MADQLANALSQHDKVRRSTDIPLYYGISSKDSISPQQLIDRIERAARVANWNTDERKCDEFFLCLRDKAISWSNTLDNIFGFDRNNWADVKREFLDAYAPKYTAKTLCTSFQDLKQKNEETVQDFYNRVSDVFRDAYQVKPDHVTTHAGDAASRYNLTQAQADSLRRQGIGAMQLMVMNTVFLGGLKEEIRVKVLESGPTQISQSVKLARELEVIVQDKKMKGGYVTEIEEIEIDEEDVEHFMKVNVIRAKQGQIPFRFKIRRGAGGRRGSSDSSRVQCRYCKLFGHFQNRCRKRDAENGAMVGADGKPYRTGQVGNVSEETDQESYFDYKNIGNTKN